MVRQVRRSELLEVMDPGDRISYGLDFSELLDTGETPQEEIRDRLQTFYEQHPERRGTLRFTEDPNVTKVAPVPLSELGVPSAMIDPATVNVGAARAQLQVFEQSLRGIDADLVIVDEVKVAS